MLFALSDYNNGYTLYQRGTTRTLGLKDEHTVLRNEMCVLL